MAAIRENNNALLLLVEGYVAIMGNGLTCDRVSIKEVLYRLVIS